MSMYHMTNGVNPCNVLAALDSLAPPGAGDGLITAEWVASLGWPEIVVPNSDSRFFKRKVPDAWLMGYSEDEPEVNVEVSVMGSGAKEVVVECRAAGKLIAEIELFRGEPTRADVARLCAAIGLPLAVSGTPPGAGDGWRPIETAPRDETWVLLWWPGGANRPVIGFWYFNTRTWKNARLDDFVLPNPTHWMPLPPPPGAAGPTGGRP